ncbi:MAG: glycoside hydrolase, partial [Treponema sp.]|nr:glycoside hydrolase [Treponema sp.]
MKHIIIVILVLLIACCTGYSRIEMTDIGPDFETETEIEDAQEAEVEAEEPEEDISIFIPEPYSDLPAIAFKEVWGYVVAGYESALIRGLPITDVVYFSAEVNQYGTLVGVPNRRNLSSFNGRVHLAVTCPGNTLTYFTLMPGSQQRETLIKDLLNAAQNYDGINIDFESIPARSGDAFLSFLSELRDGLNGKMLTIALYARTSTIANDVYDYQKIKP